ncbi:organic solute transporter Ostalpha-domain-containing protein [Dactylonectria macrodidyma]|uniref:Organic solute transporter Ostalpha-domain-containing protein n=1 Tax=Dactylonectria macrodidyma TaxID=307937 RepID=A0A9P9F654_9HYPO|nr:organic solute transporter Ostalpha-domain-containing protein [Dactylonectria macrodidyma]
MTKCEDHPLDVDIVEEPLYSGITVHGLLIGLAACACIVACLVSAYLIYKHAQNFTKPSQQRQVIRILLMVPVYSIACVFSIIFYRQHIYIAAIYEFYESLVIAAFFLLLCQLLHGDIATLQPYFAGIQPKPWIFPIRCVVVCFSSRRKRTLDGLRWFNIICVGVLQFCVVKFLGAFVKCITEAADVYCKESTSASHAKIWVMVIEIVSLVSAMMCLLQFYKEIHHQIAEHQPVLKFLAIKIVIMVFYIQSFIFSFITKPGGPVKPSTYISYPSWSVGIPNTLLCIEMVFASIFHLYAFPYQPYQNVQPRSEERLVVQGRTGQCEARYQELDNVTDSQYNPARYQGIKWPAEPQKSAREALLEALGFKDILQGIAKATHWLFVLRRRHNRAQS